MYAELAGAPRPEAGNRGDGPTLQILQQMGFTTESALTPCHAWLSQLNTKDETSDHRCLWAMMTFLLGLGL